MTLRLVFMGTPPYAVPTLRALHDRGHDIAAVYAQPPRAAGRRGLQATPSPVEAEARRLGLPVRTPPSLKSADEAEALRALRPDIGVVVAYGLILPQAVLDAPRHGCLNAHGSLLPRWRGAAPIQRAIEAGDAETGAMVMRMEAGLDTGPVAVTRTVAIGPTDTAGDLQTRLAALSAEAMVEALDRLEAGRLAFEDQAALAARTGRAVLYAAKISKGEAQVDFAGYAGSLARRINAFSPFPGAWTTLDAGVAGPERLKLLRAVAEDGDPAAPPGTLLDDRLLGACGSGALRLLQGQRAGGRAMPGEAFARGQRLRAGAALGGR